MYCVVGRAGVMAGAGYERDAAAPLLLADLREILCQCLHHRQPGRIVQRRIIVAVGMRQHVNVLVGRTRQRAIGRNGLEPRPHFGFQVHFQLHSMAG